MVPLSVPLLTVKAPRAPLPPVVEVPIAPLKATAPVPLTIVKPRPSVAFELIVDSKSIVPLPEVSVWVAPSRITAPFKSIDAASSSEASAASAPVSSAVVISP